MSDEQTTSSQKNWRARMQEVGKAEFIREEMERLGYWPPATGVEEAAQDAGAKLQELYAELRPLQSELREIDRELRLNGNVAQLLLEVRRKRIERVRAAREVRRAEQQAQKEKTPGSRPSSPPDASALSRRRGLGRPAL